MDVVKCVFLFAVLILSSCTSSVLKSSERTEQISPIWGDWVIFPVKKISLNTAQIRNDFLMPSEKIEIGRFGPETMRDR